MVGRARQGRGISLGRSRWAAFGAVIAVSIGAGGMLTASAGSPGASSFVPITPCRLLDTRASDFVGPRKTPLGGGETFPATVWGTNGNCTVPTGATGLSMNVTTVNATANSFLTVFPTDKPRPLAANLIWDAGQHPANAVTVAVSGDGRISFYNLGGTVDIVVDVVGFYEPSTAGTGPAGPAGPAGGRGFSAWDTIPSGQTVTGSIVWDGQTAGGTGSDAINVDLPGVAPVALNSLTVNFSFGSGAADADPTCTGTNQLPTAPPGKVCIYKGSVFGLDPATLVGRANDNPIGTLSSRSFQVSWLPIFAVAGTDEFFYGTWAYRAP